MKIVILSCLVAVALGAPQIDRVAPIVNIIGQESIDNGDGNFRYSFSADNGIETEVIGTPGAAGQSNMQGYYVIALDNGAFARVDFVADENGFVPQSDILPQDHPLPEHVHELLRIAEQQAAQGIRFDDQGFQI
ncbi:cuticle protein AM1159-like [Palaemon carinicauda]|uniref:cuticle protein AM1159-like n=1 Tax=Palaemon carinicauda TaxID=392227 RepID=UPI0035B609C5